MSDDVTPLTIGASGYKRPPTATRFRKGQSGNPQGRPRNRHRDVPYDAVLGQMVTIREDGHERHVTAAEAFLLQLTRKGLEGDNAAARASMTAIEAARGSSATAKDLVTGFSMLFVISRLGLLVIRLGLAVKKHARDKQRVRIELKPWIVEAALTRLGDRVLMPDDQREVWHATQTPDKAACPLNERAKCLPIAPNRPFRSAESRGDPC